APGAAVPTPPVPPAAPPAPPPLPPRPVCAAARMVVEVRKAAVKAARIVELADIGSSLRMPLLRTTPARGIRFGRILHGVALCDSRRHCRGEALPRSLPFASGSGCAQENRRAINGRATLLRLRRL